VHFVNALFDANLLVTPEQRRVLDAADAWADWRLSGPHDSTDAYYAVAMPLAEAVAALRATTEGEAQ
jgi:hypothetical protein